MGSGRSCIDNLVRLSSDIDISRRMDRNTIAVFLDVRSAYDNVRVRILCDILESKDCPYRIVKFIDRWMRNRDTSFCIGDDQIVRRVVNKGLPQGGVLSPTLYNIYTCNITKNLPGTVTALQYADDIVLYATCDRLNECKVLVERAVEQIERNIISLGLKLAPSKSNVMVFNNRHAGENRLRCRIAGQPVRNVSSVKFLGIVFDCKLSFVDTRSGKGPEGIKHSQIRL